MVRAIQMVEKVKLLAKLYGGGVTGKVAKVAKAAILKPLGNRRFCWGFGVRLPRLPTLPRFGAFF